MSADKSNDDQASSGASFKRRQIIINPSFQIRFSIFVCAFMLALSFIYPMIIFNVFEFFVKASAMNENSAIYQKVVSIKNEVVLLLVFFQVVFLGITFLMSLYISHRIAGPIYKLSKYIDQAKNGNLSDDLHFRKQDHFKEVAEQYNLMMKAIKDRKAHNDDIVSGAIARVEDALKNVGDSEKGQLEQAVAELKRTKDT